MALGTGKGEKDKMDSNSSGVRFEQQLVSGQVISGELVAAAKKIAAQDGITSTAMPYLSLRRATRRNHRNPGMLRPSICLVVQGYKEILIAEDRIRYSAGSYVASSINMPTSGCILKASKEIPYIGICMDINLQEIAEVLLETNITVYAGKSTGPAAYVAQADTALQDAMLRLVLLADKPLDAAVLGPAIKKEIIFRIINSEHGYALSGMVTAEQGISGISRAMEEIKTKYMQRLPVDSLAKAAGMSVSAFHRKFKAVTTVSPLQYQKRVRLLEARKLLLSEKLDAATVAFAVGYESSSQFSREYRRIFGAPPLQDIARLRRDPIRNPK
jgi:AraC-like DNA-binding protein